MKHTNSYAWGHAAETSCSTTTYTNSDGSWNETNDEEIKRLIALLIYFGLVKVGGQCSNYWSKKTLYHGLWARGITSRKRYKALMAFLYVVDPDEEVPGDEPRKVNSFIESFKERCRNLYQPTQNVAIDERMVRSRHRSRIRQYIKDKPTKWGIKLWVLADSTNGYTYDFNVYIGKAQVQETSAKRIGYDVVMKFMDPLFDQGYHLNVDNFYSSLTLFKD